jgi:hypothetical protein
MSGVEQALRAVGTVRPDASLVRLPGREPTESFDAPEAEMALGSMELVVIVLIVGLLFGSTLLPRLARAIIQSRREFSRGREASPGKHAY